MQPEIAALYIKIQQHKEASWKAHIAKKPQQAADHMREVAQASAELQSILIDEISADARQAH